MQLLVVGDPLCRPWARIPKVEVPGIHNGAVLKGQVELKPTARTVAGHEVDRFELFADGLRVAHCAAGESLNLDTTRLADGYCELRVVATEAGPIETQGESIAGVNILNHGQTLECSASARHVRPGDALRITVKGSGLEEIRVFADMRTVGRIKGSQGNCIVETGLLGEGPVTLRTVGKLAGGKGVVAGRPIKVEIGK